MKVQGETLDHLNEAVAVFGSDGKLKLSNPAFHTLWSNEHNSGNGKTVEGLHVSKLFAGMNNSLREPQALDEIAAKITGFDDERGNYEGRLERTDGSIVDFSLVPLPQGQSMLTFVDRTDSINMERALKERAEALEASDHLKSRFIQHVSYELRAPLTSIAGFGELLQDENIGSLNIKQAEYLQHINASSESLKAIIDDILDLATVDAGVMDLELERVSLEDTLGASLEGLQDLVQRHNVTVQADISRDSEAIVADAARLRQVLYNLISNAVTFSPDGGSISVSASTSGDMTEIAVSDEGPGVPAEMRETIFDRFESTGAGNRRQGTGLGLSIVHSFVKLHGGTVHVEESKSGGARFVCRFPREPIQLLDAAQ